MRLSLIPLAESYAASLVEEYGRRVEYSSIDEGAEDFLADSGVDLASWEELEDFIEYVDYLVSVAKVAVSFPKERL